MWRRWVKRGGCIGSWWRKPEWKRLLGRPRRRWIDNIRMDLQEVGYGYMDWNELAQDRDRWLTLVSAVMNLRVPWNAGNFLTGCKPVSFSRRTLHHRVSKDYLFRCIMHSVVYLSKTQTHIHICYLINLKHTLKHLKRTYMFRSHDHPQGAYIVPC